MAAGDITSGLSLDSKDYGAYFDGVDDEIRYANSPLSCLKSLEPFTISLWVYLNSHKSPIGNYLLFNMGLNFAGDQGYSLHIDDDTTGNFIRFYSGNSGYNSDNVILRDAWQHITIVITASTVYFYKNGVADGTEVRAIRAQSSAQNVRLGIEYDGSPSIHKGIMKDLRIYSRDLTATEILNLYNGEHITNGLVHHIPLKDHYNDVVGDMVAATITGSFLVNSITNKLKADMSGIQLPATTDKIIAIPVEGRDKTLNIIKAVRAAA